MIRGQSYQKCIKILQTMLLEVSLWQEQIGFSETSIFVMSPCSQSLLKRKKSKLLSLERLCMISRRRKTYTHSRLTCKRLLGTYLDRSPICMKLLLKRSNEDYMAVASYQLHTSLTVESQMMSKFRSFTNTGRR